MTEADRAVKSAFWSWLQKAERQPPMPSPPHVPPLDVELSPALTDLEVRLARLKDLEAHLESLDRSRPPDGSSSALQVWRFLHEGAELCGSIAAGSADRTPSRTPRCTEAHAMTPTVLVSSHALGLANQLMIASQAVHAACRNRSNIAGYWTPSGYGSSAFVSAPRAAAAKTTARRHRRELPPRSQTKAPAPHDLTELFELPVLHQRLRGSVPRLQRLADGCSSSKVDGHVVDCSETELVPVACLSGPAQAALREKRHTYAMTPKRLQVLRAMEPSTALPWHHSHCSLSLATDTYNAIHFNIDADWLLFICSSLNVYGRHGKGQLSDAEQAALLSSTGAHAPFVRRVVIPQFMRAMRLGFVDAALPVVACTSLGKLGRATLWIAEELEVAIAAAFGTPLVLGATGSDQRELNALADLRVLVQAQSAVLWPGSSFSEVAAIHRAARHAPIGWVADMRSSHLCNESTISTRSRNAFMSGRVSHPFDEFTGSQLLGALPTRLAPRVGEAAASPCLTYL